MLLDISLVAVISFALILFDPEIEPYKEDPDTVDVDIILP